MAKPTEQIGFGYNPTESKHHFLIIIPETNKEKVLIYERFEWEVENESDKNSSTQTVQKIDQRFDRLKCELAYNKWKEVENALRLEFNLRLKGLNLKNSQWKQGQNVVQRLLGKELTLLCWAIEDCDIKLIPTAIQNWQGLKPEERWWLYTMTNASTGDHNKKYGWRTAIRYALTENPVTDKFQQASIFDQYLNDSIENKPKKK